MCFCLDCKLFLACLHLLATVRLSYLITLNPSLDFDGIVAVLNTFSSAFSQSTWWWLWSYCRGWPQKVFSHTLHCSALHSQMMRRWGAIHFTQNKVNKIELPLEAEWHCNWSPWLHQFQPKVNNTLKWRKILIQYKPCPSIHFTDAFWIIWTLRWSHCKWASYYS